MCVAGETCSTPDRMRRCTLGPSTSRRRDQSPACRPTPATRPTRRGPPRPPPARRPAPPRSRRPPQVLPRHWRPGGRRGQLGRSAAATAQSPRCRAVEESAGARTDASKGIAHARRLPEYNSRPQGASAAPAGAHGPRVIAGAARTLHGAPKWGIFAGSSITVYMVPALRCAFHRSTVIGLTPSVSVRSFKRVTRPTPSSADV